jgi:hypothetical protein
MAVLTTILIVAGIAVFAFVIYAMARRVDRNARLRSPRKPSDPT